MIEKILLWLFGSIVSDSEHPNQVNDKKLATLVAGGVYTYYMASTLPTGWEEWSAFFGLVGAWNTSSYLIKKVHAKKEKASDTPG